MWRVYQRYKIKAQGIEVSITQMDMTLIRQIMNVSISWNRGKVFILSSNYDVDVTSRSMTNTTPFVLSPS